MRSTLALCSALILGAFGAALPVQGLDDLVITEFMAANDNTLADEDGDFSDWVEIYNAGTNTVNLLGWKLTDNSENPGSAWSFPATNLPINSFIVVFCSGKDRRIAGQELHTDFKLNDTGDYLALLGPDGTPRSSYATYPLQVPGMSYGVPVSLATSLLISNGSPARFTVPLNDSLGLGWTAIGFNDASWVGVNNGVGFEAEAAATGTPQLLADSVAEFSGNQGSNGWSYGYWDKKADADGRYSAGDFTAFPRGTGTVLNSTNYFDGTKWDIPSGNPPYTEITSTGMHPSAEDGNPSLPIHWAIRRYVAEAAGPLRLSGVLSSWNTNGTCGDGVVARIIVDGTEVWQRPVFFTSEAYSIVVNANLGSTIDFALDAGDNDFCDATTFTAQVRTAAGYSIVADTIADWSASGTQGEKNWSYGFYNRGADPGQIYNATDFVKFPSGPGPHSTANFWNGAAWQWFDGDPPYDTIGQVPMRPSQSPTGGTNGYEHWVIRRWISDVSGTLQIDWHASKQETSPIAGVGTVIASVYQNGVQRDTVTVTGTDYVGALRTLTLGGVQVGDAIDFVLAPGADAISDRSFLNAIIHGTATLSNQFASDVGAIMTNLNSTAYLRIPFAVSDPASVNGLTLRLKYDDGYVAYLNGVMVASGNAPLSNLWNSASVQARPDTDAIQFETIGLDDFRDLLVGGNNVLAIQGLNASASDQDFLLSAELTVSRATLDLGNQRYFPSPTPGAINGVGTTSLGPLVTRVRTVPAQPADDEDLFVTARVSPTLNPVSSVRLYYRVMFGSESNVFMQDDGLHGDGIAGDGIYGATVPASISGPGQLIRYYFTATDTANHLTRQPPLGDTNNSSLFYGTVVLDTALTNPLPVLHWYVAPGGAVSLDNGTAIRASLFWNGEYYDNIKMTRHGQSSQGFRKKSYNVDFNPDHHFEWDPAQKRVDDINLLTTYPDKAHMRNVLGYETHRDAGYRSPHHYVVPVRMQSNGVFHGVMHIVENGDDNYLKRIKRDVNGALYKMYDTMADPNTAEKKTRRFEDRSDLRDLISRSPNRQWLYDNVDISQVIDFLAAMIVTGNVDCCHKNYYVYRDTEGDGEWEMLPWDVDLSFGRNWSSSQSYWDDAVYPNNGLFVGGNCTLPSALFASGTPTRQMYLRRVRTLQEQLLQTNGTAVADLKYEKRIDELAAVLAPDAALDLQRWGSWGNGQQNIFDTNSPYWRTLPQSVAELKTNYMPRRRAFVFDQRMGNASEFPTSQPVNVVIQIAPIVQENFSPASGNQNEEYIRLLNTNNIAVDISGWKLSGAVTHTFQGGVVLPGGTVANPSTLYVVANKKAFRARTTGPRSGQTNYVEGPYEGQLSARGETVILTDTIGRVVSTNQYVGNPSGAQQYLRITELMYHPPRPPAGSLFEAEDFEYIELRNTGPTNIDLTGVHFSNGIDFTFPASSLAPGAYVLVVRNLAAFTSRYGAGLNVAGQYSGILDNSGENIRLDDKVGEKILDFTFNNSWYPITDGPGASLVIVNDAADWRSWDLKTSWRPSAIDGGSAGATDGVPATVLPVLITEVLTHTDPPLVDAIELWNTNATAVNLNGWFLTDDFASPKKYTISGVTIPAGGYAVFYESNSFGAAFALSSRGDETYVFSGDGIHLTGFFHGYAYGAAESGVSFGRYVNSQTNVHFVAQSANTLGGPNAAPKVGPVVISEINYRPVEPSPGVDNEIDEYLELANITAGSLDLFDPAHPANTWRLRSAVDFDFPGGVSLAAGEHIILVSFHPLESATLAKFRARYGLAPAVRVFGPFSGQLGNSGESVRLYRPDTPDTNAVPYILVDQVDYSNQRPWPAAADGIGPSLQRVNEAAYGNDPINWIAVGPSAGVAYVPGGTPPTITRQPADTIGVVGRSVQFSVEVAGTEPFFYQWRFNGVNIGDASGQVLTLPSVRAQQAGAYSVVVFNSAGSVESLPANLSVLLPVTIAAHPQPVSLRGSTNAVNYGFTTNSATFTVLANTQRATRYQWRFNGMPLFNQTNSSLTVPNVGLAEDGIYDVIVSDDISSVISNPARLTVLVSPVFLVSPVAQTVASNGSFTATAVIRGNPAPFRFEWREISTIRGTNLTSETTNVFSYGPITNSTSRQWRLVVFNEANPSPGSLASFSVTAVPDADQDGIPDAWESQYGFDPGSTADRNLDSDGDGLSNFQEYIAGTDPTNSLSYLRIDQAIVPGTATVQLGALANKSYTIRYTDALGTLPWTKLVDVPARTVDHAEAFADPTWTTNRFYQVVTPAQPQ